MDRNQEQEDMLLEQFFNQQRFEVADDGFSQGVMRLLPDRARRLNRLWTALCMVVAVVFFIVERGWSAIVGSVEGAWADITTHELVYQLNPLTIYMALVLLAIVGSYRLLSAEKRHIL